jgi:hypothetical protein
MAWIDGLVYRGDHAITPAGCWAFQLANACIAIALFQTDILMLRLMFVFAAIFFMLFGGVCLNISLDTIAWNILFGFIHVRTLVPLILDRIPPKIEPQDKEVYNKVFRKYGLPLKAFKILIDASYKRKSGSGNILEGGKELKLCLMSDYNGYAMLVKKKDAQGIDRVVTKVATQQPWCGIVGYIRARRSGGKGVDTNVVAVNTFTLIDPTVAEDVADDAGLSDGERLKRAFRREELHKQGTDKDASYYEWSYDNLNSVFQHVVHGDTIRNVIDASVLNECEAIIEGLDTVVAQVFYGLGEHRPQTTDSDRVISSI